MTNSNISDLIEEFAQKYDLKDIKKTSNDLLELHKTQLQNTLRYFGNGIIVPIAIEAVTKHHFLKHDIVEVGKKYEHEGLTFEYTKISDGTYIYKHLGGTPAGKYVEQSPKIGSTYHIDWKRESELLYFTFDGKTYREMPETGNTYIHTTKQGEDLKRMLAIDVKAGLITTATANIIDIVNDLHDIPEGLGSGDQIMELKSTHTEEDNIMQQLLDTHFSKYSGDMKDIINRCEQKHSYFKLFERIRYLTSDLKSVVENKEYLHRFGHIYYDLFVYICVLETSRLLPNGIQKKGKEIPSIIHELKNMKPQIDDFFKKTKSMIESGEISNTSIYKFGVEYDYTTLEIIRNNFLGKTP